MSPLELIEGVCGYCYTDGCDVVENGVPCHRLCAEEAHYRASQERTDEIREAL